jgi:predicted dehydrogenase
MTLRCLVIGVGKMGLAHLQVLAALKPTALAGWAPSDKRRASVEGVGAEFLTGNLEHALKTFGATHVIIATPVETLAPIALQVMTAGVRHILLEKPAALTLAEGRQLIAEADLQHATIYVGYNRRFYSSFRTAVSMMQAQGERVESVVFEFNEVVASAGPAGHVQAVRERWLLANSLHVIDAALFPIGPPDFEKSNFLCSGNLSWHPAGQIFVGSGKSESGVPYAYHANWGAPGRWGVEWMTPSMRYVFRPMEKLSIIRKGRFELEAVQLDDKVDVNFKPGVYHQNKVFLDGDSKAGLVPLAEALSLISLAQKIAGYPEE